MTSSGPCRGISAVAARTPRFWPPPARWRAARPDAAPRITREQHISHHQSPNHAWTVTEAVTETVTEGSSMPIRIVTTHLEFEGQVEEKRVVLEGDEPPVWGPEAQLQLVGKPTARV